MSGNLFIKAVYLFRYFSVVLVGDLILSFVYSGYCGVKGTVWALRSDKQRFCVPCRDYFE